MSIESTFDPAGIVVTVGHVTVKNLSADEGISVEMRSNGMQFDVGLDGSIAPRLSADRSATIRLSVLGSSSVSGQLQALTGYGTSAAHTAPIPITIMDKTRGVRLLVAPTCYLSKGPGLNLSESGNNNRVWEFVAESITLALK